MLTAAKEETFSAPMVWTDECVLPLAAAGVYPKTRVWGSKLENVHCSSATPPLRIELRWGCEKSSEKTAVGSGVSFKYDPFGRRVYKSSSSATSVYTYDGDNLVEETNATGTVVARYEQTQNIDEPLAMLRSSATSYFHADGLGSVTSLSNAAGTIANTYTYDSFGKLTASTGSLVNPFQYTARESDTDTGLYYYRARYYDPQTGRFLSEDPTGFAAGADFYSYGGNSPSNFVDPTGLAYGTSYDNGTITVSLAIVLYGSGANSALAALWQKAIADAWNKNGGYGKCKVAFNVTVTADPGTNNLFAAVHRSGYGPKNWIYIPPNGEYPSDHGVSLLTQATGSWSSIDSTATIAHEAGHLLGFYDHYNPFTKRPYKGRENDIMAESGSRAVMPDEIPSIVGNFYDKECGCKP